MANYSCGFSIKRLFSRWNPDSIKVVRRVIVSVVGATVVLIGIALLVLPGPAFVVIPVGLAILATDTLGHADGSEKFAELRRMLSHQRIAASRRNTQPNAPNTRLTTQNERFFVSAEIAAMAIAI